MASKSDKSAIKLKDLALKYRDGLDKEERTRYDGKLQLIGGEDPYEMPSSTWSSPDDVQLLPNISYPDIVNYLVFTPSPYTSADLKSYKGLDAYNQFVCGWVREKATRIINDKCLVKAKVLHSQRMSEKPLQPWIIADREGCILGAHCTCMAGLGEACTHIAALLFAIEASVKLRNSKTVTEEKAYWLLPASVKGVSYKECREIDFTSAKTMKKKLDCKLDSCESNSSFSKSAFVSKQKIPEPTESELASLFKDLHTTDAKPGILSLIAPYSDDYVPRPMKDNFPTVLTELRDDDSILFNYSDLLKKCQKIEIIVTEEQAKAVEIATREQSNSKLWYQFRSGRITASKMKSICTTDPTLPAQSLIKSVCYPQSYKFSSRATAWGCEHEKFARDIFLEKFKLSHDNVKLEEVGFFISVHVPFIGASPDGIVTCDCCGQSVVEIKCPFCVKNCKLTDIADKDFYLKKGVDNQLKLDVNHQYYILTSQGFCVHMCPRAPDKLG